MQKVSDIIAEARSWLWVPWAHQGRTRAGIDCVGLIVLVCRELALVDGDYDYTNYQRRSHGIEFMNEFKTRMKRTALGQAKDGDVMLFRDNAYPCHAAFVASKTGYQTIIHAHAPSRRVVETNLQQGDWLQRRVACFRFKGVANG